MAGIDTDVVGMEYWRTCAVCPGVVFDYERSHKRHLRYSAAHTTQRFECVFCEKDFSRKDVRDRHQKKNRCLRQNDTSAVGLSNVEATIPAEFGMAVSVNVEQDIEVDVTAPQTSEAGFDFDMMDWELVWDALGGEPMQLCDANVNPLLSEGQQGGSALELTADEDVLEDACGIALPMPPTGSADAGSGNRSMTPGLSRGSSAASIDFLNDTFSDGVHEIGFAHGVSASKTSALLPSYTLPLRTAKFRRILPTRFGQKCTICNEPYETDVERWRQHLDKHWAEQQRGHPCEACDIGFVHLKDLTFHLVCAEKGHCGLGFRHTSACTGHHPRSPADARDILADHDRFKMEVLTRHWETSQSELMISSTQRDLQIKQAKTTLARLSLPELVRCPRASWASLVFSLHSCRSDPRHSTADRDYSAETLKHLSNNKSLTAPLRQYWQRRQRLKELRAASEALGPAAANGDNGTVTALLDQGGSVDHPSKLDMANDVTPLLLAVAAGHGSTAEILLDHGASVRACDSNGRTVMQAALENDDVEIARMLLDRGALRDVASQYPLDLLRQSIATDCSAFARLLLEQAITPDSTSDQYCRSLLSEAVAHNSVANARVLLEYNSRTDAESCDADLRRYGYTLISKAVKMRSAPLVSLLLATSAADCIGGSCVSDFERRHIWALACGSNVDIANMLMETFLKLNPEGRWCTESLLILITSGDALMLQGVLDHLSTKSGISQPELVETGLDGGKTYSRSGKPMKHVPEGINGGLVTNVLGGYGAHAGIAAWVFRTNYGLNADRLPPEDSW